MWCSIRSRVLSVKMWTICLFFFLFTHKTPNSLLNLVVEASLQYDNIVNFHHFFNVDGLLDHLLNETAIQLVHQLRGVVITNVYRFMIDKIRFAAIHQIWDFDCDIKLSIKGGLKRIIKNNNFTFIGIYNNQNHVVLTQFPYSLFISERYN